MAKISFYRWSVIFAAVLAWKAEGLASQSAVYKDALCQDELATVLTFKPTVDRLPSGEQVEGDWNECYAFGTLDSLSVLPTCDSVSGNTSFIAYTNGTCSDGGNEVVTSLNCQIPDPRYQPIERLNASVSSQCVDGVSATEISADGLIFTAEEYNEASCTNPTGDTLDIDLSNVSEVAHAFGYGVCGKSACMESGTLIIQQYRTDEDSVCYSEEVAKEIRAPDAGDYISLVIDALCVPWESTGLYYRPTSCSTTGPTTTPTPTQPSIPQLQPATEPTSVVSSASPATTFIELPTFQLQPTTEPTIGTSAILLTSTPIQSPTSSDPTSGTSRHFKRCHTIITIAITTATALSGAIVLGI